MSDANRVQLACRKETTFGKADEAVVSVPVADSGNTGKGTVTQPTAPNTALKETWTLTATATPTIFDVVGSETGVGNPATATVDIKYTEADLGIVFTINQGDPIFDADDKFTFDVNANFQIMRHTGESLKQDTTVITSEEIRSDRQIADIIRTGVGASGGVDFELSYGTFDDFLQAVLFSAGWSTEKKIEGITTISALASDNSINDSAEGFVTAGFVVNQWIRISGFTKTANNGWFKIVSVTIGKIVLSHGILIDEDPVAETGVSVQMGAQIVNGVTLASWNLEREYKDLTNIFSLFTGMCISEMGLAVPADGRITGSFTFLGAKEVSGTASVGTGNTAATTTNIMTGANHVDDVFEDKLEAGILSFAMSINNNLRTRLQVGTLGAASVGSGSILITGSLELYLPNATLFDKYLNQTPSSFAIGVTDGSGNGYIIEIPTMRITNGSRPAGGLNTDVVGTFEWQAYMDPTEEISVRITRFPVLV